MWLVCRFTKLTSEKEQSVSFTATIYVCKLKSFAAKFPCVTPLKWLQRFCFRKLPLHPARWRFIRNSELWDWK